MPWSRDGHGRGEQTLVELCNFAELLLKFDLRALTPESPSHLASWVTRFSHWELGYVLQGLPDSVSS